MIGIGLAVIIASAAVTCVMVICKACVKVKEVEVTGSLEKEKLYQEARR